MIVDKTFWAEVDHHLDMLYEANRLATFKNWIFNDDEPCSAAKLAEAGFYFVGSEDEPDAVQCFLCNKSLDGWEAEDDPWNEHLKHSSGCSFAKLYLPEKALTLAQLIEMKISQIKMLAKSQIDEIEKQCMQTNEEIDEIMA